MRIHNTFTFGETDSGKCLTCDSRTALVSFFSEVSVDQEPFEDGEFAADSPESEAGEEIPESVTIREELTGHYCLKCGKLTSVSFNG